MDRCLGHLIWSPAAGENRSRIIVVYSVRLRAKGQPRRRANISPIYTRYLSIDPFSALGDGVFRKWEVGRIRIARRCDREDIACADDASERGSNLRSASRDASRQA